MAPADSAPEGVFVTYRNLKLSGMSVLTAIALGAAGVMLTAGGENKPRITTLKDDCNPATFNAALGPGACVGDGETTFAVFNSESQQERAEDWRMDPTNLKVDSGRSVRARNEGGETHTFTEVAKFGGGFVPPLNALSGDLIPAPECLASTVGATIVPAGALSAPTTLGKGMHKFQCCIHPWMRTIVRVEKKD
jgi:plastocyanin